MVSQTSILTNFVMSRRIECLRSKKKEKEKQEIINRKKNRYNGSFTFDKDKVPDFEKQLPTNFNIKNKRSDALGIRSLFINENELVRAHRPDMDKLIVLSKLRHEIKSSKYVDTPTPVNNQKISLQLDRAVKIPKPAAVIFPDKSKEKDYKLASKFDSVSLGRASKIGSTVSDTVGLNYKGKQDLGNVFNGIRKNFYPTYGVTYTEQKMPENKGTASNHNAGYRLHNTSTKKLLNSNSSSLDLNMKMKGKEYASSLEGVHMKRKDYELNNISIDNLRPFYHNINSKSSFETMPQIDLQPEKSESELEIDMLRDKVNNSLLVNRNSNNYPKSNDQSLIGGLKVPARGKIKLPKLRENITLHITTRGTTIIQSNSRQSLNQSFDAKSTSSTSTLPIYQDENSMQDFQRKFENFKSKYSTKRWKNKKMAYVHDYSMVNRTYDS